MHKRSRQGFTLIEMLIVVAIIAVLVAIAIPTFSGSLHKAREAADLANARAYYAYLQADYMTTGEYQPQFKADAAENISPTITYLDGTTVKLQTGTIAVCCPRLSPGYEGDAIYQVWYTCNRGDKQVVFGE